MKRSFSRWLHPALLLAVTATGIVHADEVRVLAAGAAKAALEKIAPEFQRATGHPVAATYDTVGAQRDRVLKGEAADLVILSDSAIAQLATAGRLSGEQRQFIGNVAVSLAVPAGAAVPDISTPEALKLALAQAPTIAYADPARGATAGTHFDKVLVQLGLRDALMPKLHVLPFGVDVIKDVAAGKYALGVSQSSEILQHDGIAMVGPLPPPYALTTGYSAAITSPRPAAELLLQYLAGSPSIAQFRDNGFLAD